MNTSEVVEQRMKESRKWIISADREFVSFKNEIRNRYIPIVERNPDYPQKAIESLNLCVEKMIKSVAIASGFEHKEVEKYSHNSLKLCADIFEKFLQVPMIVDFADRVQGQIFKDPSKGEFLSHGAAIESLEKVKSRIYIDKNKELSDWAYTWANMHEESIKRFVKDLLRKHKIIKIGGLILRLIPMWILRKYTEGGGIIGEKILSGLEARGFEKSQEIRDYFKNSEMKEIIDERTEEDKLLLVKYAGDYMVFSWILNSLWILAALTSIHGTLPRYPGGKDNMSGRRRRLTEESYSSDMGIVRSVRKVGKLVGTTKRELSNSLDIMVETFLFYDMRNAQEGKKESN